MSLHSNPSSSAGLTKTLGTWQVFVAGVALVVAASTLVSDFSGFFTLGGTFVVALGLGFLVNLLLAVSAADLSTSHPRAGALFHYVREIFPGVTGERFGVFLGLAFFGMFAFAVSGETAAGAIGLQALTGIEAPLWVFISVLGLMAVVPNLLGIRTTAWVSALLLLFMLGIRWWFGLAGFLSLSDTGTWSADNLRSGVGPFDWFSEGGVLRGGLAVAFWSFVGIEFACSLAEEVRHPRKAMPRGLVLGLVAVLATSLIMGLGVTGTLPLEMWQAISQGELGAGGEAPQLAVGYAMFGQAGFSLMALASVTATLGTLTVAYAAMPRILFSIARDSDAFGRAGRSLARLHPRFQTPTAATLVTFALFQVPGLFGAGVIDWIYSAAYAWILLYLAFHILAAANRWQTPGREAAFPRMALLTSSTAGFALTVFCLYFAFEGSHLKFGGRALLILGLALAFAFAPRWTPIPKWQRRPVGEQVESPS
jgi:amino acid transporter